MHECIVEQNVSNKIDSIYLDRYILDKYVDIKLMK